MDRKTKLALQDDGLEAAGRYYALYRGTVADNNDPEKRGRLLITIDELLGKGEKFNQWVYGRGVFVSDQIGIFCIPKVGSMVFVEFINGDPELPIWSAGWYPDKHISPTFKDEENYLKGTTIVNEKILIKQKDNENFIEVTNEGIFLEKDGTKINMDSSGILMSHNGFKISIINTGVKIENFAFSLGTLVNELFTILSQFKVLITPQVPSVAVEPVTLGLLQQLRAKFMTLLK